MDLGALKRVNGYNQHRSHMDWCLIFASSDWHGFLWI